HTGAVWTAEFSPDGNWIATGSRDGTARLWDARGKERFNLTGHTGPVAGVVFAPRFLATASWDGTARLWDIVTGRPLATLLASGKPLVRLALSPDGQTLATVAADGRVNLWSAPLQKVQLVTTLRASGELLVSAAFSPDGTRIATATTTGRALLWSVPD